MGTASGLRLEGTGHGGRKCLRRKGSNNLPRFTPLKKTCEIYAPRGDGWTCLRRATCSSVSALISPRELEGGQFGWVVRSRRGRVGCIAGDPRAAITNEDESETRRRRGPGVLHVESTKYGATLLTGGDRSSKQETSTRSLLPPHFKILVSLLFKTNHIFNCAAPDNSILTLNSMNRDSLFSSNVRLLNFTFPSIFKLRSFKAVHCKQVQPDQLNKLAAFAFCPDSTILFTIQSLLLHWIHQTENEMVCYSH